MHPEMWLCPRSAICKGARAGRIGDARIGRWERRWDLARIGGADLALIRRGGYIRRGWLGEQPAQTTHAMFDLVPAHTALRAPLCFEDKQPDGRVYLRAPHTVIQLVEVAAPPPRRISSVVDASAASSSYSSSSSSSSFAEEEMDEEEESVCSSYCSSDDYLPEAHPAPATHLATPDTDAFARKMKRILLWRAHSEAPAPGTPFAPFHECHC